MNNYLTKIQQQIVSIAAFTASGNLDTLKIALTNGLNAGLTINQINEVLVQIYAYAGFPRSLNGISTFMTVVEERKAMGINDPRGEEPRPLTADVDKYKVGTMNQTEVVGQPVVPTKGTSLAFAPASDVFLKEHLFGDIFARGVLTFKEREIVTIAVLTRLENVESQLVAHINCGLNVGLTGEQITEIFDVYSEYVDKGQAKKGQLLLQNILKERKG